mgnify:CR=1 FL=1
MQNFLICLITIVLFAGCQSKQEAAAPSNTNDISTQRKEASVKLTQQAIVFIEQKNIKDALSGLDAAIKLDPTNQDPYLILGQILIKAGQYDHAVDLLDNAAKSFTDNGMVFYMLSVANKMADKKLPAALSARRSFEIFKQNNDKDNALKSAALLQEIIAMPDHPISDAK